MNLSHFAWHTMAAMSASTAVIHTYAGVICGRRAARHACAAFPRPPRAGAAANRRAVLAAAQQSQVSAPPPENLSVEGFDELVASAPAGAFVV